MEVLSKFEFCEGLHRNVADLYENWEDKDKLGVSAEIEKIRRSLDSIEKQVLTK